MFFMFYKLAILLSKLFIVYPNRSFDRRLRLIFSTNLVNRYNLTRLNRFVRFKEMFYFLYRMWIYICKIVYLIPSLIIDWYTDDFVI